MSEANKPQSERDHDSCGKDASPCANFSDGWGSPLVLRVLAVLRVSSWDESEWGMGSV